jgi:predicted DsbA family dithiol-disulfide isomerase
MNSYAYAAHTNIKAHIMTETKSPLRIDIVSDVMCP